MQAGARFGPYGCAMTVSAVLAPAVAARSPVGEWDELTRIPPDLWLALLEDEETRERYQAKIYRSGPGQCAYWLGSLSSGGHGRFRAGTRRADGRRPGSVVVVAHGYGYLLSRGITSPDPATGRLPIGRHRCDEPSCQAPRHLAAGTAADNAADFAGRRCAPGSPLTDRRGPRERAAAIRDAIRQALAGGASPAEVELAIEAPEQPGSPERSRCSRFDSRSGEVVARLYRRTPLRRTRRSTSASGPNQPLNAVISSRLLAHRPHPRRRR